MFWLRCLQLGLLLQLCSTQRGRRQAEVDHRYVQVQILRDVRGRLSVCGTRIDRVQYGKENSRGLCLLIIRREERDDEKLRAETDLFFMQFWMGFSHRRGKTEIQGQELDPGGV